MPQITKDSRFQVLNELIPRGAPSRSEQRILKIIDGAIRSYAENGIEGTTFASIAKAAKTSRPLVQHYFKDKAEIFDLAVKSIRIQMQQMVVEEMKKARSPADQLEACLRANLNWRALRPDHSKVWVLFWYQCTSEKKAREVNTELQRLGAERIESILRAGIKEGVFHTKHPDQAARLIQAMINGVLVLMGTENLPGDGKTLMESAIKHCLELAQSKN